MNKFIISLILFLNLTSHVLSNEVITRINENWNQIKTMSGNFVQIDPDGNKSEGQFYFLKPYLSKFEYKDRTENVITNKKLLRIVDNEGYQIDSYSIGNSIFKNFLSDNLVIETDFEISEIIDTDNYFILNLNFLDKNISGSGLFYFDKSSLDLKKWEILDEFKNKTVLEFTKIKKNISISENLFVVKYRQN